MPVNVSLQKKSIFSSSYPCLIRVLILDGRIHGWLSVSVNSLYKLLMGSTRLLCFSPSSCRRTSAAWWSLWTPTGPCPSSHRRRWRSTATGTFTSSVHTCESPCLAFLPPLFYPLVSEADVLILFKYLFCFESWCCMLGIWYGFLNIWAEQEEQVWKCGWTCLTILNLQCYFWPSK